jgi:hypothetical protein
LNTALMACFVFATVVAGALSVSGGGILVPAARLLPVPVSSSRPEQAVQAPSPTLGATRSDAERSTVPPKTVAAVPARARPAAPDRSFDAGPPYPPRRFYPKADDPIAALPPVVELPVVEPPMAEPPVVALPVVALPVRMDPPAPHKLRPVGPLHAIVRSVAPDRPAVDRPLRAAATTAPPGATVAVGTLAGPARPVLVLPLLTAAKTAPVEPVGLAAKPAAPVKAAKDLVVSKPAVAQPAAATAKTASRPAPCHHSSLSTAKHAGPDRPADHDD